MKNLKRALSLVLSAAMMVGMMVVGTSAAYDDVKAEHNAEAIAMMQAAGIMTGDDKGNFNPDAKITRNEMAVVMSNMLGLDTDDFAGASQFTDVPAWALPYVDACFANGIVSGVSATQYNGAANVTTREAALMMLKALGYFQYSGDFGNDWALATIKQAAKIDLLDDVKASATAALTRNEVAQLALNALESKVVYATKSGSTTSITTDDVKIEVTGEAVYHDEVDNDGYNYNSANKAGDLYLIEKLYEEDFKKQGFTTDLQQPGHKWVDTTKKLDDQKVVSVAKDAKYTIVVDKANLADTLAVYNKYIDEDAKAADVYAANTVFAKNGVVGTDGAYQIGDVVELYTNSDGKVTDVIVMDYSIGKIDKIDTKTLTKAQKEDGATCKVTIKGESAVLDNKFAGFDYEKGDYVLYILSADKSKVLASELAESVEGKVATLKSGKATIGGTAYPYGAPHGVAVTVGETGTFYLGKANEIMLTDTVASSEDYIYIYNLKLENKLNNEGINTSVATAYTVDAEGVKAVYDVALDIENGNVYFEDTKVAVTNGMKAVIAYSVNSDGKLVYETAKDTISGYQALTVDKNAASGTTSATEFVFVNQTATAVKVNVVTGYKNVNIAANGYTVVNSDGKVILAFVDAKNGSITSDAALAVVTDPAVAEGKNDDDDATYTYVVAIDGVESELTFKSAQTFTKGQVIAYEFDGDWAQIDSNATYFTGKTTAANDDYVTVNGKQYNLTGDEIVYTIVLEYKNEADFNANKIDSASVAEGGEIEKNDDVVYTVDDDVIETIFVYEYVY